MAKAKRSITKVGVDEAVVASTHGPYTREFRASIEKVVEVFTPTGVTAPPSVDPTSTKQLPMPSQLTGEVRKDINGTEVFQIIRTDVTQLTHNSKDEEETVVAFASNVEDGNKYWGEWSRIYSNANMDDKAFMLGVKELAEAYRTEVNAIITKLNNGHTTRTTTAARTITLVPLEGAQGVATGESSSGKKRLSWFGHSGFGLARYLGSIGCTGGEAVDIFDRIGLPMGKTAIVGGCYAGRSGKRGEPAKVTKDQDLILRQHLMAIRGASNAAAEAKLTPADEAKINDMVAQTIRPSINKAAPAPAKTKQEKLDEAIRAKNADRKAKKQAATAKAQATKAKNKVK